MLEKGAVRKVPHTTHHFLRNLFLVGKKDMGNGLAVNLGHLNSFVP